MLLVLYPIIEEKERHMLETYFARTSTIDRLHSWPLGPDREALASALRQQGYARDSIRRYLRGCDQCARWLCQHEDAVTAVTPTLVQRSDSGLTRSPAGKLPP